MTDSQSPSTWVLAGDVAANLIADIANKAKDRTDTELDAKRIHDGKTLDQFLAGE